MSRRYLIVDDESLARSRLERLIKHLEPAAQCEQAPHGFAAITMIEEQGPWDAVFLDIEMPQLSGLQLIQKLRPEKNLPPIIFCTAYSQYAIEAFRAQALDYLLKPVEEDRLRECLNRLISNVQQRQRLLELEILFLKFQESNKVSLSQLAVKSGNTHKVISSQDIIYIRADLKLTAIVTHEREWLSEKSLDQLEAELPTDTFLRCHRSILVNLKAVKAFHASGEPQLLLCDHHSVPVSRRKKSEVKKRLGL